MGMIGRMMAVEKTRRWLNLDTIRYTTLRVLRVVMRTV